MAKHSPHMLALARKGAEARYRELLQEAQQLIESFPDLRAAFDKDELPVSFLIAKGSGRLTPRKRRGMSAAGRKRISEAQKARWAKQRKMKKA